jgi:hypothetical protein
MKIIKGKALPVHTIKKYKGAGAEAQLHLFLSWAPDGDKWSTSRPGRFTPGKGQPYPLNRWLRGHQNRPRRFRRKLLALSALRTPSRTARSLVTTPTELHRLL